MRDAREAMGGRANRFEIGRWTRGRHSGAQLSPKALDGFSRNPYMGDEL
jgi:hypothetical protein